MEFEDLMRAVASRSGDNPERPKISRFGEIEMLLDALGAFQVKHEFRIGQIVRQKPACRTYREHSDNHIAIVVELLAVPIVDTDKESGSSAYRQMMDMVVGVATNGTFSLFHVDSRRYEPATRD